MNIFRRKASAADPAPLTAMDFEILLSLAGEARHGYAIMQDVEARSESRVRPGSLYRAIARLLDSGFIAETSAPGRLRKADDERRRYYAITPAGRRAGSVEARRLARQVNAARARKLLKPEA